MLCVDHHALCVAHTAYNEVTA